MVKCFDGDNNGCIENIIEITENNVECDCRCSIKSHIVCMNAFCYNGFGANVLNRTNGKIQMQTETRDDFFLFLLCFLCRSLFE